MSYSFSQWHLSKIVDIEIISNIKKNKLEKKEKTLTEKMKRSPDERQTQTHKN